jgi:hypothetical protein
MLLGPGQEIESNIGKKVVGDRGLEPLTSPVLGSGIYFGHNLGTVLTFPREGAITSLLTLR